MAVTLDAHQHFWDFARKNQFDYGWLEGPKLATINRSFLPGDLKPHIDQAAVDATIVVQTQHSLEENRWALGLAEENPQIAGVVGWVDLASDACEDQIVEFKSQPKFVGVRHIVQDEPDDDFVLREDVLRGFKLLEKHQVPFDLLFFVKHLRHAKTLAQRLPDLPMVINHLAKPEIAKHNLEGWLGPLKEAAACPNIYCKLSGMITEADWKNWKPADLKPYVEPALELFGPERLMFGSDWPVCNLAGNYQQVIDGLTTALGPVSDSERDQIFGKTARAFYGIL